MKIKPDRPGKPPRPAPEPEPAPPPAPPAAEPWLVQVIFIDTLDAVHPVSGQRISATLTDEGRTRNLAALEGLEARLNTESGGDHFRVRIDHRGPLTTVTAHGDAAWASIDDVAHWIDPAASVILTAYEIDNDFLALSLNGYGGLGYFINGIAYGAVPAWDGQQLYILDMWGVNPHLHELLHGVCGYLASRGVPMPELHEPAAYGYTMPETPTSNEWYRAILSGQVAYRSGLPLTGGSPVPADGQMIGCTPSAWAAGRPTYG